MFAAALINVLLLKAKKIDFFCLIVLPMRRIQRCNHATCLRIMLRNFNRKVCWRSYLHWPESRHVRWGLAKLQSALTSVLALPTLLVMLRVDWAQSLDTDPLPPPWTFIRPDVLLSSCDSILARALPSDCTCELIPAIQKVPSELELTRSHF